MEGKTSEKGLDGPISTAKGDPHVTWSSVAAHPGTWFRTRGGTAVGKRSPKMLQLRPNHVCILPKGRKLVAFVEETGTAADIQVNKSKLVSVFATKFSPDLNSETLSSYIKDTLGRDVTCQKIETLQSRSVHLK